MSEEEHEVIDPEGFNTALKWAIVEIQGSSALSLERDRPYDGQPHTDQGERGKQIVNGLTMRDIADCIVRGFLDCGGIHREVPIRDDIYSINLDDVDPGAVIQNAMCHIERYMGIFPNLPDSPKPQETK